MALNFPYGASLSAFLDSYDQAERRRLAEDASNLRQAVALRNMSEADRQRKEQEQLFGDLATEIQARRAIPTEAPNIGAMPTLPMGMGGAPDLSRAETQIGPMASTAPVVGIPTARPAFGASLPPERAARLFASPTGQAAMRGVEESEKEAERNRFAQEAKDLFGVASERLNANDLTGGFEELAKAYNRLGRYQEGRLYLDRALKLRSDKDETEKANKEMAKISTAAQKFKEDPSASTHGAFLQVLTEAETPTIRAFRMDLLGNQIKAAIGKDVFSAMLWKKLDEHYSQAWAAGKTPDFQQALTAVYKENPALVMRAFADELEKNKDVGKEILRFFGIGEEIDPKDIKDFGAASLKAFRFQFGRPPRTRDEFNWVLNKQNELAKARKQAEKEGTVAGEDITDRNRKESASLRTQMNSMRLSVDNLRRQMTGPLDPAQREQVRDELTQAEADLADTKKQLRDLGALPKEVTKPSEQTRAARMLKAKPFQTMAPVEKQAVIFDVMKRSGLGGPDLNNGNLAARYQALKPGQKEAIRAEIERIEGRGKPAEAEPVPVEAVAE